MPTGHHFDDVPEKIKRKGFKRQVIFGNFETIRIKTKLPKNQRRITKDV